ncbi:hypothetical protein [Winogradskyella sp. A3E31]|uniref:hypothetical protein n=1 Tax=Winogradskyella sp. A3E31 TaxID=3349637 RepID=UPI00398B8933
MKVIKPKSNKEEDTTIFMGIDHLRPGNYQLKLTFNNEVVKTLKFKKSESNN